MIFVAKVIQSPVFEEMRVRACAFACQHVGHMNKVICSKFSLHPLFSHSKPKIAAPLPRGDDAKIEYCQEISERRN